MQSILLDNTVEAFVDNTAEPLLSLEIARSERTDGFVERINLLKPVVLLKSRIC